MYSENTNTVTFNKSRVKDVHKFYGSYKNYGESQVKDGWLTQPNMFLHELGHYLDHYFGKEQPDNRIGDLFSRLDDKKVEADVSGYAATDKAEFMAEIYSGILYGKVYPEEYLKAANLDYYTKVEIAQRMLSIASGEVPNTNALQQQWGDMIHAVYTEGGASFKIELLANPEVEKFIDTHAQVLDNAFVNTEMSDTMRARLKESDWIFSGAKTFHELGEAFPSLLDEKGNRKTFEQFLNDVQTIDQTYNRNYLNAEYNLAQASAEMAAKWEKFEEDGDDYLLQYRTAGDDKVRPEHAELNGITLPMSDSFWDTYYPPNGWNCRCTVVQVLKDEYEQTPHDEAMQRGKSAIKDEKASNIFGFNPGKEGSNFPAQHPYFDITEDVREALESLAPIKTEIKTAKTIEEAQAIAEQFCESNGLDRTFKGKVSFSGISVANANEVLASIQKVFAVMGPDKIAGIKTIDPESATGKKAFNGHADTVASYDPVTKGIYLNKAVLKNEKTFEEYMKKAAEAFETVKKGLDKLSPEKRAIAERYIWAGRELVDDTIQGCIAHELGHHMQWTMMPANLFNSLREGMAVTAKGLSGYAGTSGTEYVAESFVSWLKGELRIDYRLQEFFDSKCQIRPVDGGTWKDVETSSGSVRISSLHGNNETSENLKIAKYLAEKHGRELDLIPKRENVKTPDAFDKGDGRFVEFKTNSSATANSIDRALRDASHQANNIVISLERGLPLGTLTSVVHERVRREDNIKTVCIIKDGKDVLLKRAEILRDGFKIEEADFK